MLLTPKKKVLILGGEGFIGRNIAAELAADSFCYSLGIEESLFGFDRRDVFVKGNPYQDKIDDKFDVYIHLIDNQVSENDFEKEEMKLIDNIRFPLNSHLIIFSSAVIYANSNSSYAKRKIKLEKLYANYCLKQKVRLTILRLFNIYGKFQLPYKQGSLIANILFNYQNNMPIEITNMSSSRDFIYAGDMARFVRLVIEDKFYGKTDLATGKLISIAELLNVCRKKVFSKNANIINKNDAESNVCPIGDNVLLKSIRLTSLEDGLNESYSFYEQNSSVIKKNLKI